MSNTNTNEPAFPRPAVFTSLGSPLSVGQAGMTLRDYFAAKVMQSLIATDDMTPHAYVATEAYSYADAMLKARNV